ncbi:MAG: TadE/TadG family type IV pilus assembly protein [Bryobacteraceae bacterium]
MTRQPIYVSKNRRQERGGAMVEVALMAPWIFFLFVGIFDFGFYTYAVISTENAARFAAQRTAADEFSLTDATACDAAKPMMIRLPNYQSFNSGCTSLPLIVQQDTLCSANTPTTVPTSSCLGGAKPSNPAPADSANDNTSTSSRVTVTYQSIPLIPIPGVLTNRITFVRRAEMRVVLE